MNTLNMTVICNIQAMTKIIGNEKPFKELENKTLQQLHTMQENLIPVYNSTIKKKGF